MSTAIAKNFQVGSDSTATNNFTIRQPTTPDGTVRIANGNSGTTTDLVTVTSAGNVGVGTSTPRFQTTGTTAGATTLSIYNAAAGGGGIELATGSATTTASAGRLAFTATQNTDGSRAIAWIDSLIQGNTSGNQGGSMRFAIKADNAASTVAMTIDSSGNLGLGVTPSAWGSGKAIEVGSKGTAIWNLNQQNSSFTCNAYYDGAYKYGGTGLASSYQQAAGVHYWYSAPSGTAGNAISFTQAMTLDASGALLLNTTSGSGLGEKFGVVGSIVTQGGVGTNQGLFGTFGGSTQVVGSYSNIPLEFRTNNTERARITSGGDLLVGMTTSSTNVVGIRFSNSATVPQISVGVSASSNNYLLYNTTAAAFRFFVSDAGQINATSTSITAISDVTLKENIRDLETGLAQVLALRPRRFDWKEETHIEAKGVAGFIAQEVESVLPDLVYDYQYNADKTKKALKMGDILPTLVKAIQELKAELDSVKTELALLKGTA